MAREARGEGGASGEEAEGLGSHCGLWREACEGMSETGVEKGEGERERELPLS